MEINRLGRTGIEVTRLGLGGGPFGGLFAALDDESAAKAMEAAWDSGIRYFDTSPHYGIGQFRAPDGRLSPPPAARRVHPVHQGRQAACPAG